MHAYPFATFMVQGFFDPDSATFSYIVFDKATHDAVIIDSVLDFDYSAGSTKTQSADQLLSFIASNQLKVHRILETHAHADHLSAAPYLKQKTGARIGIGERICDVQAIFKNVFNLEKEFLPDGRQFDDLFADGQAFSAGSLRFRVMHTPGHTPADIAYIVNDEAVFVGDTLFMPDVGTARCDFPGGSSATLFDSIQKLLALPETLSIFICHDYPPAGREHACRTSVAEQAAANIHVGQGASKAAFIEKRDARDATLSMPKLIIPSVQVNVRAGRFPAAESNGVTYLKIPLNQL